MMKQAKLVYDDRDRKIAVGPLNRMGSYASA
jgi:hypothetical protein